MTVQYFAISRLISIKGGRSESKHNIKYIWVNNFKRIEKNEFKKMSYENQRVLQNLTRRVSVFSLDIFVIVFKWFLKLFN